MKIKKQVVSIFDKNSSQKIFDKKIGCRFLSTLEAANFLSISPNALRIKVCRGEIKFFKFGRLLRFDVADLKYLLKKGV